MVNYGCAANKLTAYVDLIWLCGLLYIFNVATCNGGARITYECGHCKQEF